MTGHVDTRRAQFIRGLPPTEFVRTYVLYIPPIQVDRLRRSIDLYRSLTGKIENLKAQTASLAQIQRIVARVHENERSIRVTSPACTGNGFAATKTISKPLHERTPDQPELRPAVEQQRPAARL